MMLILAAVNGESTLRGMLIWAQNNWEKICWGLGMGWLPHPPAYGTVWQILIQIGRGLKSMGKGGKCGSYIGKEDYLHFK